MKMRENVKRKLAKYLRPLLQVPSADNYHWWFTLMLNPRYVNEFTDVRALHEIQTVDTSNTINETTPKLYDYIVATELVENPYTAPPSVTTENRSLYFNGDTVRETRTDSRVGVNILRDMIES